MGILIITKGRRKAALETKLSRSYMLRCNIERTYTMTFHISPVFDRVLSLVSNVALLSGLVLGAAAFAGLTA
jgi:hypothetical protein